MKKIFFLLALAGQCFLQPIGAQVRTPQLSPPSEIKQAFGLGEVHIEYARPNRRNRTIFAEDGLVPYGKLWRTGAGAATKITFTQDVKFGGSKIEAGSFAMLTIPDHDQWTINLYPYESTDWMSYVDQEESASVVVEPRSLNDEIETFTLSIQNLSMSSAELFIVWDKTLVAIPIETEVDAQVMANIEQVMAGPTAQDLFLAASYYHDTGKDLEQALEWITLANEKSPRYWQLRKQSLIEADLGETEKAITSAKRSLELAKEAGNEDYVRMNEASILEWTKKRDE